MGDRAVRLSLCAAAAGLLLEGCAGVQSTESRRAPPVASAKPATAVPAPQPPTAKVEAVSCGLPQLREEVLKQVNIARASARACGNIRMRPAKAVSWSPTLASAAAQHSSDMATRGYFNHVSPDGRRVGYRVASEGYNWRTVGENLAGGDSTVAGAIRGWLGSPAHCQNLMNPAFVEVGAACVHRAGSQWGTYWTLVLASRR